MSETKELKKIKKLYGESFMHLCRDNFPSILEKEGLLTEALSKAFSTNSKTLAKDILSNNLEEEFKNYIYAMIDVEKEDYEMVVDKTPYELLDEAGYDLYECTSEKEIQEFRKYYAENERLCTFRGGRLNKCVVFFAVKKNVDEIKREDFERPRREDEYGTSVMGIQFTKYGLCTVSIKNRYNHTVNNPDATYGNDLDRITPGLQQSFANLLKQRKLLLNSSNVEQFVLPYYITANDSKIYKYNKEVNGINYCPGNIIIDYGNVMQLESEKQILVDYFIIDKERKEIRLYDDRRIKDSFVDGLKNIEDIKVRKYSKEEIEENPENKNGRIIEIIQKGSTDPIIIEIDENNEIVGYKNSNLVSIGDNFLSENFTLKRLELPNVKTVGNKFLYTNQMMTQINMPKLEKVGNGFFYFSRKLRELNLPTLKTVGDDFLKYNLEMKELCLSNLKKIGKCFMMENVWLGKIDLPEVTEVGSSFMRFNRNLKGKLSFPNLEFVGDGFLESCDELEEIEMPKLIKCGNAFLATNNVLKKANLQSLKKIGKLFFDHHESSFDIIEQIKSRGVYDAEYKEEALIDKGDIAKLDKETSLTTTEMSFGKKIIEKIKNLFKTKEEK